MGLQSGKSMGWCLQVILCDQHVNEAGPPGYVYPPEVSPENMQHAWPEFGIPKKSRGEPLIMQCYSLPMIGSVLGCLGCGHQLDVLSTVLC